MAARALLVLVVGLLAAYLVEASSHDEEKKIEGPRGVNLHVKKRGGGMRFYRNVNNRKTGEIEVNIGKIRERNDTDVDDDDDRERPPPPRRRHMIDNLDDVDFHAKERK